MTSNWQRLFRVAEQLAIQLGLPAPASAVRGDAVTRADLMAGELAAFFELVLERVNGPASPQKRRSRRKIDDLIESVRGEAPEPAPEEPGEPVRLD